MSSIDINNHKVINLLVAYIAYDTMKQLSIDETNVFSLTVFSDSNIATYGKSPNKVLFTVLYLFKSIMAILVL